MPRALPELNRWHWLAGASLFLTVGLPLGITALGSLVALVDADTVPELRVIARAAYGTAASALGSTLIGIAVGLPLADLLGTLQGHTGRVLRFAAWLPLAVPPLAYALGVRRLIEIAGLSDALLNPATAALPLLPLVLSQSSISIAVTAAALVTFRLPRGTTARLAGDDVARVLGAPALVRSWTSDPTGTRTGLVVGGCLSLIHGLSSMATSLAFPASTSLNLGATLARGGTVDAPVLLAVTPFLFTLPLLVMARLRATRVEHAPVPRPADPTGPARSDPRALAAVTGIVAVCALCPLTAVLFTGLGPVAVGALLLNAPAVDFSGVAMTSLAMLGAAALGALMPFTLSVPPALEVTRRSVLPWITLVVPSVALVLAAGTVGLRPLAAALLLHLVLGFAASLPIFQARWNRTSRGSLDSALVLGASTWQTLWWEDRGAFARLLTATLAASAIASVGDVTAGAVSGAAPVGLGNAAAAFLASSETARGAYAIGAVLALAGIASLFALEAGRVATTPMWWRR